MRHRESGFTLIELMIAVAVVAILAAIALPSFFRESRKTKATAEVPPIFSDLRIRIEQYLQENGTYPASLGETTLHPTASPTTTKLAINPLPASWLAIKVQISGSDQVFCGYTWVTGISATSPIGTQATAFGFVAPASNWYYLLAKCNMDNDASLYSWYFSSSVDPTIKKLNEGS